MIKIFTLNLWRYYDFEKRLPFVVKAITKTNPDIVFLQEVQIDKRISSYSQVEILKEHLKDYKFSIFSTIYKKTSQQGKLLVEPIQHGMAILSKYPMINSFEYYVNTPKTDDEPRSILCVDIEKDNTIYKFANIHFTNEETIAQKQLVEFISFLKLRKEERIMAGDFNLFNLSNYKDLYTSYLSSYDYKEYISYKQKTWCLDYVLIPKNFVFKHLETIDNISDHAGIYIEIENKQ